MATEVKHDGFILFDTQTGKPLWGLRVYSRKCDAANSYNAVRRYASASVRDNPTWKKQDRVIAKPIRIIDAMTDASFK